MNQLSDRTIVWLVEDNDRFRLTLAALIDETTDMISLPFRSCEEALDALDREARPDLVLMDFNLPGMNGVEGTHRLRAISPTSHVIMLTVHEEDETVFEALCAGASGYLLKSASAEEVLSALENVREGGAPINPQIARKVLSMFQGMAGPRTDYGLTTREREILNLLVDGHTKRQIADSLFVSYHTIDSHIRNIYEKLHVHSRSDAVAKALKERLV